MAIRDSETMITNFNPEADSCKNTEWREKKIAWLLLDTSSVVQGLPSYIDIQHISDWEPTRIRKQLDTNPGNKMEGSCIRCHALTASLAENKLFRLVLLTGYYPAATLST